MNFLAVGLATLSAFLLGGLWYSKVLFLDLWTRDSGATPQNTHPAKVFGFSFIFALIAALGFGTLLGPHPTLFYSLQMGALVGVCFVATSFGINYQFGGRSVTLLLIDGTYHITQFLLYALIFGLVG